MASTRNKNTAGNYALEMQQNMESSQYSLKNNYVAQPIRLAGYGFLQGHLPQTSLSKNSVDIESFLFGINSTNLAQMQQQNQKEAVQAPPCNAPVSSCRFFHPELQHLDYACIIEPPPKVILPAPFHPLLGQRPY